MTEHPDSGTVAPGQRSPRGRGAAVGLVILVGLVGAALLAVAAGVTWWSADYLDPLTGPLVVALSGSSCVPELIPLALVGLAGLGATSATGGVPRRLVGVALLAAGGIVAVRSALSFGNPPAGLAGSLSRPADLVGAPQLHVLGPTLGVLGGVLLSAAGALVGFGVGARRLGRRYERTGPAVSARSGDGMPAVALEEGDWWKALDAGGDPTDNRRDEPITGSAAEAGAGDTVSEQTSADGYDDPQATRSASSDPA